MTPERCRRWRESIGALVLGALDSDEERALRAHLAGCADCRREAEELQPLATLLGRVEPATLRPTSAPPPHLRDRVLQRIRAERRGRTLRRGRLALAGAMAAAALTVGALAASGVFDGSEGPAPRALAFQERSSHVELSGSLTGRTWGTEVRMTVHGVKAGTLCHVWLRDAEGRRVSAGTFRYRYGNEDEPAVLTAAVPPDHVTRVAIRAGGHRYVVPVGRE